MTLEQFIAKATVRNYNHAGFIGKSYTYEGLEYLDTVYGGSQLFEYYISLGEEVPYDIFIELLGELD